MTEQEKGREKSRKLRSECSKNEQGRWVKMFETLSSHLSYVMRGLWQSFLAPVKKDCFIFPPDPVYCSAVVGMCDGEEKKLHRLFESTVVLCFVTGRSRIKEYHLFLQRRGNGGCYIMYYFSAYTHIYVHMVRAGFYLRPKI